MKEFVGDQRVKALPSSLGRKVEAPESECGRIQMLQAPAGVRTQMQDESVIVIRDAAEHRHFGFDNFLDVSTHPFRIVIAFAVNDDAVRHAAHFKIDLFEVAGFDR
jgi:hypothetical protein